MIETPEVFSPPPDAPVFEPSFEEFEDPLSFIAKIKPIVEKVGICKIKPPPEWQPPFVVDVDNFKFVPRMQKINELEATTRVKLNFLDKLLKFWELQGTSMKIPTVDRKLLDFHKLHKTVQSEGGYGIVSQDRKWNKVAFKMGMSDPATGKCSGSVLKSHYEKYLYPFDLFEAGITVDQSALKEELKKEELKKEELKKEELKKEELKKEESKNEEPKKDEEDDEKTATGSCNETSPTSQNSILSQNVSSSSSQTSTGSGNNPARGRKRKEDKFSKTYSASPKKDTQVPDIDYSANSELKKLQFFGAGPKAAVPLQIHKVGQHITSESKSAISTPVASLSVSAGTDEEDRESSKSSQEADKEKTEKRWKMRDRSANWRASYVSQSIYQSSSAHQLSNLKSSSPTLLTKFENNICVQCERNNNDQQVLVCDGCDAAYHTYCLVPPLVDMPKGEWRCPKCVAKECNKPKAAYGFEQAKREFTLQEFGEMADQFKADYFQMPVHMVPCEVVEKEFWRLTTCLEEDITVHYGADIHALTKGSGFPTKGTKDLLPGDEKYINSPWNLNNLPVHDKSVLKYVTGDVSGMKVPWCYVGMCFSSFCWHIEDHWSYSVNYMHWGEPKTWYGVPSSHAEQLEEVMRSRAPELFEQSPDLLHHITTIMNPNLLMSQGIPIVKINQHAGEFVLTFPRAYHAGFNQGYNFAEAVNFCPADWLPFGRGCINNYKLVKRQCVFSHEELICKMTSDPDSMDLRLAAQTHQELLAIVGYERINRRTLLQKGVVTAEQEAFELIPDDERQCCHCKTTCFLSAITCPCRPNIVSCVEHINELCSCPPSQKCLRYRYTLEEMPAMIRQLKRRAESYDSWLQKTKAALSVDSSDKKLSLAEINQLIQEAKEKRYPDTTFLKNLQKTVADAEKCADLAARLINRNLRQPLQSVNTNGDRRTKLSITELEQFAHQMTLLPCVIKETKIIQDFLQKIKEFQKEAQACLVGEIPPSSKLEKLHQFGCTLDLDLTEVPKLKQTLALANWLEEVQTATERSDMVALDTLRSLIEKSKALTPHSTVEKSVIELQDLITSGEKWEEKAKICLQARPRHIISTIEAIISEAKAIPVQLPNVATLKEALQKAKEWITHVEKIQMNEHYPYLEVLEDLVNKGRPIPVRLDLLPQVESQVTAAKSWKERTARTFLKKNSTHALLEVLSPRSDIGVYPASKKRKKKDAETDFMIDNYKTQFIDPVQMVESFKQAELSEMESMRALRAKNMEKHRQEDSLDVKYCLCRKNPSGVMFQCELCKEWFHGQCVPISKPGLIKNKSQSAGLQTAKENKFLCPFCLRSRRPRLETILSLLVSLQKLPVRLPEGEALQCLTERAMAWQDRARQALATDELASALSKLSMLSQRKVEQAAREKTEKIINAELLKAASNPELQGQFSSTINGNRPTNTHQQVKSEPKELTASDTNGSSSEKRPVIEVKSSADLTEHAYSTVSKATHYNKSHHNNSNSSPSSNESPRKHARKSPLIPRSMDPLPPLELSDIAKAQLEELMMEGDLLEVSLDETQHIWKILQACTKGTDKRVLEFEERDLACSKSSFMNKKEKKRKFKQQTTVTLTSEVNSLPHPWKKSRKEQSRLKKKDLKVVQHGEKKIKMKKVKKRKSRLEPEKKATISVDKLTGEIEEDEDCSAKKCLKPSGDEVDWVQCDKCELWFHLTCLGLSKHDVSEDEDFLCNLCKVASAKNLGAGDQSAKVVPGETEEIISVVSTPVPSAAQSPVNGVGQAGDGNKIRLAKDMDDGIVDVEDCENKMDVSS